MNSVVRQLWEQNTDVVMVDTGNSYEGLCELVGGKYISYTEEKPITMNPFKIDLNERNVEKFDFLKNLIVLIWKGSEGSVTELELNIIDQIISEYYAAYFDHEVGYTPDKRDSVRRTLLAAEKRRDKSLDLDTVKANVENILSSLEKRRNSLVVESLSFNSFYEFSTECLEIICIENNITDIDYDRYGYMLRTFYKGGKYDKILNESVDSTLFDETFIVFEIDAIKGIKNLFPIVILIIMDVFLQKMRLKKNRKVLVIEEAWKAIATPLMAEYIKYLYKTARKFWASVGVVTQEIEDIISSPIVKEAIINNSDVFMLLDQSKFKERFDSIKAILGLTDVDCRKIFTINRLDNKSGRAFFREVFVRRGSTSGVYGSEDPRECYMTYTTERAEKEALKIYKAELSRQRAESGACSRYPECSRQCAECELHCSFREVIERYVSDWNASGINNSLAFAQKVNQEGHVLDLPKFRLDKI